MTDDMNFLELTKSAWKEALEAEGADRFALVMLMITMTVVPPVLLMLMLLELIGVSLF